MTAQDKLNRSARAHGWTNWSEVLMNNAPAHVINLIVEEAMRGECEIALIETYVNRNYFDIRASEEKLREMAKEYKPKDENGKSDFYLGWRLCFEWASGRDTNNPEQVGKPEPDLTWRPGARVRITVNKSFFSKGDEVYVHRLVEGFESSFWLCGKTIDCDYEDTRIVHESDAVVVG